MHRRECWQLGTTSVVDSVWEKEIMVRLGNAPASAMSHKQDMHR